MRPSDAFSRAGTAVSVVYTGCRAKGGWVELRDGRDVEMCPNMRAILDDGPGSVAMVGGRPVCPRRHGESMRRRNAEEALYRQRMAGDWS